jgi:hypothetical protein
MNEIAANPNAKAVGIPTSRISPILLNRAKRPRKAQSVTGGSPLLERPDFRTGTVADSARMPCARRAGGGRRARLRRADRATARGVKMGPKFKLTAHQQREAIKRRDTKGEPVREICPDLQCFTARFRGLKHERDYPAPRRPREEHAPVLPA